jgi:hypothetical protein
MKAGALSHRRGFFAGGRTADQRACAHREAGIRSKRGGCLDFHLADVHSEDPDCRALLDCALGCTPDTRGSGGGRRHRSASRPDASARSLTSAPSTHALATTAAARPTWRRTVRVSGTRAHSCCAQSAHPALTAIWHNRPLTAVWRSRLIRRLTAQTSHFTACARVARLCVA